MKRRAKKKQHAHTKHTRKENNKCEIGSERRKKKERKMKR